MLPAQKELKERDRVSKQCEEEPLRREAYILYDTLLSSLAGQTKQVPYEAVCQAREQRAFARCL